MSITYHFVPIDVAAAPQTSGDHSVYLNRYWEFVPFKGLVIAKVFGRFSPQCNDDEGIAKAILAIIQKQYPEAEVIRVPCAMFPLDSSPDRNMMLPRDQGVRFWDMG